MFSWRGSNDGTSGAAPAATPPSSVSPTLGSSMPGSLPGSFPTNSLPPSMDENSDEALVAGMKARGGRYSIFCASFNSLFDALCFAACWYVSDDLRSLECCR